MTTSGLSSVFWLGGGSGAGKTTLARAVAGRLDLRVYHVDVFGYNHIRRMTQGSFPQTQAFNAKCYADRWLRVPAVLAEEFLAISRERMSLIIEDLAAFGPGATILAEGPQLLPELVEPLMNGPGAALWLLPEAGFGRRGVMARGETVPISEEAEASENRFQRDVLVTSALRRQASERGLKVVDVDGGRSLDDTVDWLVQLMRRMPGGLHRAGQGVRRAAMRRRENLAMAEQLTAYWEDLGPEAMSDPPAGPFNCECRVLGCAQEVMLSADEYLLRAEPLNTHAD